MKTSSTPPTVRLDDLPTSQVAELIGHLQGILFFAKDTGGRFIGGNEQFVQRCGFRSAGEMMGQNDRAVFPKRMADKFHADDVRVMTTGEPMLDIIELFPNAEGEPEWFSTNKLPLRDAEAVVTGVCGTVQSLRRAREYLRPFMELEVAADQIRERYAEKLDVEALARKVSLSVRHFERRFREVYQLSARHFQIQIRVVEACRLLRDTPRTVSEIALDVGFYDHSAFARQFQKFMGESAGAYRARFRRGPGVGVKIHKKVGTIADRS